MYPRCSRAGWQERDTSPCGAARCRSELGPNAPGWEEGLRGWSRALLGSDEPVTYEGQFLTTVRVRDTAAPALSGRVVHSILIGGSGMTPHTADGPRATPTHWNAAFITPEAFNERSVRLDEAAAQAVAAPRRSSAPSC